MERKMSRSVSKPKTNKDKKPSVPPEKVASARSRHVGFQNFMSTYRKNMQAFGFPDDKLLQFGTVHWHEMSMNQRLPFMSEAENGRNESVECKRGETSNKKGTSKKATDKKGKKATKCPNCGQTKRKRRGSTATDRSVTRSRSRSEKDYTDDSSFFSDSN